jgi:hypothetical protein
LIELNAFERFKLGLPESNDSSAAPLLNATYHLL